MPAIGAYVRGLAYVLIPVALVLSHRNVGLAAALIGLTALPLLARLRPPPWAWPFLGLVAWLALSSAWTPTVDDRSWAYRLPIAVAAMTACVLASGRARPWEGRGFAGAVLLGVLLLGVEALTGGAIRDLVPPEELSYRDDVSSARGVGIGVLLLPAALLCLRAAGVAARPLTVTGTVCVLLLVLGVWRFGVVSNGLALLGVVACGAAAALAPRRVPPLLLFAAAVLVLVVPLGAALLPPVEALETMDQGPLSWRQRLVIWRVTADAATADLATFLFGAGQNASTVLGEASGTVVFPGSTVALARVPDHPHSLILQLWYEGGAVALGLAAMGLLLAARAAARVPWPRDLAAAASAVGAAWIAAALVEIDLWSSWRWACLALAVFALRLATAGPQRVVNRSLEG